MGRGQARTSPALDAHCGGAADGDDDVRDFEGVLTCEVC